MDAAPNGAEPAAPLSLSDSPIQHLAIAGVVLDADQLLVALRVVLPRAIKVVPLDQGAQYAVLFGPPT